MNGDQFRNSLPVAGGSGRGVENDHHRIEESNRSFASTSKSQLIPPTYISQTPRFRSSNHPAPSSSNLPSLQTNNSNNNDKQQRRKGGRKSAFDNFDEITFCNDLASKIANELALRPQRFSRRSAPIDPWRGTIPGSTSSSQKLEPNSNLKQSYLGEDDSDDEEDDEEEEEDEEDEDEDDDDDEEEEDDDINIVLQEANQNHLPNNDIDPIQTERTKAAAQAFLQRLAERQENEIGVEKVDDQEKDLEKQVFEIFGDLQGQGGIIAPSSQSQQQDQQHEEEISPEVAKQVAQLLHKSDDSSTSRPNKPLVEVLGDSSTELDQLKSTSSEAALSQDGADDDEKEEVLVEEEDEEQDEDENDEDEIDIDEDVEEEEEELLDNQDEGEEFDDDELGDDNFNNQSLYTAPYITGGANQEEAISLIDSDEEMEDSGRPQEAAGMTGYGDYDEDEEDEEDIEVDDDDEAEAEDDDHLIQQMDGHLEQADMFDPMSVSQAAPFNAFNSAFDVPIPSESSELWQNTIQQSLQVLNNMTQIPPPSFEQSTSSTQPGIFPSAVPDHAFSPNMFEQQNFHAMPTSFEEVSQISPPQDHQSTMFPLPTSAPPPPINVDAQPAAAVDGEDLLRLKEQVNAQKGFDQLNSRQTSLSPVPPSTAAMAGGDQSVDSSAAPIGQIEHARDLVDLKNVVLKRAAVASINPSNPASITSDIGTPKREMSTRMQAVVEDDNLADEEGDQIIETQSINQKEDQNDDDDIEITEVRSTTDVEGSHIQPDIESVASFVAAEEGDANRSREIHIQEVITEEGDIPSNAMEDPAVEEKNKKVDEPEPTIAGKYDELEAGNLDTQISEAHIASEDVKQEMEEPTPQQEDVVQGKVSTDQVEALLSEVIQSDVEEEAQVEPQHTEETALKERKEEAEEPISGEMAIDEEKVDELEKDAESKVSLMENDQQVEPASDELPTEESKVNQSEQETEQKQSIASTPPKTPSKRKSKRSKDQIETNEDRVPPSSTKKEEEHSSPNRSHRKPRHSDPDGDLADYMPEEDRKRRLRSRTKTPPASTSGEIRLPSSGIPDKFLNTSILEEDENEDTGAALTSPTPISKKRGRKSKKESNAIKADEKQELQPEETKEEEQGQNEHVSPAPTAKSTRKRGRKSKKEQVEDESKDQQSSQMDVKMEDLAEQASNPPLTEKKKRGRKSKKATEPEEETVKQESQPDIDIEMTEQVENEEEEQKKKGGKQKGKSAATKRRTSTRNKSVEAQSETQELNKSDNVIPATDESQSTNATENNSTPSRGKRRTRKQMEEQEAIQSTSNPIEEQKEENPSAIETKATKRSRRSGSRQRKR